MPRITARIGVHVTEPRGGHGDQGKVNRAHKSESRGNPAVVDHQELRDDTGIRRIATADKVTVTVDVPFGAIDLQLREIMV